VPGTPQQLAGIALASLRNGVPPNLLYGIWGAESDFSRDSSATRPNSAGAVGPFQITKDSLAHSKLQTGDPNNFPDAANAAAQELKADYNRFHNWDLAIAAYNAGAGAVASHGNQIPPYPETQAYVPKVNQLARGFTAAFKSAGLYGADPSKLSQLAHEPPSNAAEQVQATVENVAGVAASVAEEIGKIATILFSPATWLLVLEVVAGTIALFFGLRALTGQTV
jgi:hypothetical protein